MRGYSIQQNDTEKGSVYIFDNNSQFMSCPRHNIANPSTDVWKYN